MESMAYLHYQSPSPGSEMWMVGDVRFKQKEPIGHKGIDNRYNVINSLFFFSKESFTFGSGFLTPLNSMTVTSVSLPFRDIFHVIQNPRSHREFN